MFSHLLQTQKNEYAKIKKKKNNETYKQSDTVIKRELPQHKVITYRSNTQ